ncbi:putative mitochondrial protein AtMg00240 [Nicotiana tabacum]|uniref:Mitochondrial protein AtMg00240 n=1 Tax=Nicotiana tabacum TaxID=4097 RepID=A0AC58TGG7_TOBAC
MCWTFLRRHGCRPVNTPTDPNSKLLSGQRESLSDPARYRRLIGKLNYPILTRLEISFPVTIVSQFMDSPCDTHRNAVVHILWYIKSALDKGSLFEDRSHEQIVRYLDVAWARSPSDRCYASRYCVLLGVFTAFPTAIFNENAQIQCFLVTIMLNGRRKSFSL